MNNKNKIHLGIYGLYVKDKEILAIKKARGPYTGKYDLPGGRIEFSESFEEALKREFLEETGAKIKTFKFLKNAESVFKYLDENDKEKEFHHIGMYYIVDLDIENLKVEPDGHDSNGAEFVKIDLEEKMFSPIAYSVIKHYLKNNS